MHFQTINCNLNSIGYRKIQKHFGSYLSYMLLGRTIYKIYKGSVLIYILGMYKFLKKKLDLWL